ncbi:FkbM family methyltransferase [Falsiroseomonas ponticola]|uniref:FkbM family methyltransferase n=1 Tax=Falsiroseomonas ponticola TaxID=2786951 RepID=UPI0019349800|nr:FkbM family methyltransferase [Roseomonas ponticola]
MTGDDSNGPAGLYETLEQLQGSLAAIERQLGGLAAVERGLGRLHQDVERLQKLIGPFGVYLGDGVVMTQMLTGLRFLVPAADHVMAPKMIGNRVWEPRLSAALPRLVRPDRDVVDVGANIGYFSINAAMILGRGKGCVVHAIEPNPQIHALLLKNISINWSLARIIPHQLALGETEGELLLHVPGQLASNGTLLAGGSADANTFPVPVRQLHQVVPDPARIGLMKIDVEGAEAMVVKGAAEVIREVTDIDIVMEWDTAAQGDDAGATAFLAGFFAEAGFSAFVVENDLAPTPIEGLPTLGYCNLFLTRHPKRLGG